MQKTSRTISLAGPLLSRYLRVCLAIVALLHSIPSYAEGYRQNFIFFPEAVAQEEFSGDNENTDFRLTILHYSQYKQFKTLLEFSGNKKHGSMERAQIGWEFGTNHLVWLGRGHTPLGYWNTEYHHGTYLQTSLSRPTPTLITWPRHTTGLSIEGSFIGGKFAYNFSGGRGATQEGNNIEDYELLHHGGNHGSEYGTNIAANFSFRPDPLEATEFGIFIARFEIPVTESTFSDLDQTVSGLYLNWEKAKNRVTSEVFYHRSTADTPGKSGLTTGYLQYERQTSDSVKLYFRIEDSWPDKDSQLLNIFDQFPSSKQIVGLRFDAINNHAITMELSRATHRQKTANVFSLKWSAIFP